MGKNFTVELTPPVDSDGQLSALMADDLQERSVRRQYLDLLSELTNDIYFRSSRIKWPRGPNGSWISFPLGTRVAICQLDKGDPDLWSCGLGCGKLTVMRIVSQEKYHELLAQGSQPWTTADLQ